MVEPELHRDRRVAQTFDLFGIRWLGGLYTIRDFKSDNLDK
jgi:hypothetical protein